MVGSQARQDPQIAEEAEPDARTKGRKQNQKAKPGGRNKTMKKLFAFAISAALLFSYIPAGPASAAAGTSTASGSSSASAASGTSAASGPDLKDATIVVDRAQSFGEMDYESGEFEYDDSGVTLPGKRLASASLPSKYDLREQGRVTAVKDQTPRDFCWAFASIASVESNLITNGIASRSVDLSEAHLAYFALHGKSSKVSKYAGGDTCFSSNDMTHFYTPGATLVRGYGAVSESSMPFSLLSTGDPIPAKYTAETCMLRSDYEIDSVYYVSAATTTEAYDKAAMATVKELIMKNGAVATKMDFPDSRDWADTFGSTKPNELEAYYSDSEYPNHAVTVVGWDDSFDDFTMENRPTGPGAWIIKDSYGTELHGDGYFYISYYSPCLSQFVSFTAQKNSRPEMYQYDGTGPCDGNLYSPSLIRGANRFTARSDVMLDHVTTFTPAAGCRVNIKIYAARNGSAPASGTKLYDRTFTKKYAGFTRTVLGKKIGIPKGMKFSVIVTAKTPSGKYYIPFEVQDIENKGSRPAPAVSGQSYIMAGGKWKPIDYSSVLSSGDEYYRVFNATVKALGRKAGTETQKIKVKTVRKVKRGKSIKLKAKRTKGSGRLVYQSSKPGVATVTSKGTVKAKKKGTVKITVYALPTSGHRSVKKVVKVKVR